MWRILSRIRKERLNVHNQKNKANKNELRTNNNPHVKRAVFRLPIRAYTSQVPQGACENR